MKKATLSLSVTELPQYRLLVEFAARVEDLARVNADEELLELIEQLRAQMMEHAV